jgi:hypothetical protein
LWSLLSAANSAPQPSSQALHRLTWKIWSPSHHALRLRTTLLVLRIWTCMTLCTSFEGRQCRHSLVLLASETMAWGSSCQTKYCNRLWNKYKINTRERILWRKLGGQVLMTMPQPSPYWSKPITQNLFQPLCLHQHLSMYSSTCSTRSL